MQASMLGGKLCLPGIGKKYEEGKVCGANSTFNFGRGAGIAEMKARGSGTEVLTWEAS